MAQFTREEARALLEKVMGYSQAESCEANLNGSEGGNIRYARNTVTTSGYQSDVNLAIQSNYGLRSGTVTLNEFSDEAIEGAVRRSEELARLAPDNPEFMAPLGPQEYVPVNAYFDSTANIDPAFRARAAADSIVPSREQDLTAAGFLQDSAGTAAMMNTNGLFAYHRQTSVNFSATIRTPDGTGSGWASRDYNDVDKFDSGRASEIAIQKAIASRNPRAVEPGKYTVILEPAASVGLLQNMIFNLNARRADEGRSFLSKPGGGTQMGEKIVDERVTIYSDPAHADVPTSPWTGDGQARRRRAWIENGVVTNMFYSRYWAREKGVDPVPGPANGIMEGGTASVEDLVRDTRRGILVTRTWYIRTVDPQTLLYTGLTRDGTYFIENGEIAFAVKNFRFNESPVIMLNNLEALGRPVRINGNLIPPMKIRDFTFSSLSDAV
jgi:predicted Zn-dependent protease